jgi:hypothetical protein
MRHSKPELTANIYTDPKLLDVVGAIESLPAMALQAEPVAAVAAVAGTANAATPGRPARPAAKRVARGPIRRRGEPALRTDPMPLSECVTVL